MTDIFTCILLLLSLSGTFGKYVYIMEKKDWHEAQSYCRQMYTDLAPVSNQQDTVKLQELSDNFDDYIWIGLERNSSDKEKWMWSGGGAASTFFWAEQEPNNLPGEDYAFMKHNVWYDAGAHFEKYFFCYSAVVVREKKTWEEALEYCRENHTDLASVASETELLLIQKELSKNDATEHVWIGLHFSSGDWQWVDGQEQDYEAWGQGVKTLCPHPKMKCAALQANEGGESVWVARDCKERLHFICY